VIVRQPTSEVPAHWSKDFVEHLRTVHFALIAISAGLILLVASSREYNPVTALVQVDEIIDLRHQWSLDWIKKQGSADSFYRKTLLEGYVLERVETPFWFDGVSRP
jgi:hypothetical protein